MNNLKTLKDIDFYEADTQKEIENRLKAEAVKWVKNLHDNRMYEASSEFIDFFNLTEEDLQ